MYIMLTNYKGLNGAVGKISVNTVENHYLTFSAKTRCQKSMSLETLRKFSTNKLHFSILAYQLYRYYVIILLEYEVIILG